MKDKAKAFVRKKETSNHTSLLFLFSPVQGSNDHRVEQEDSINNSREETKGDAGRPMLSSRRRGVIWTPQAPELGLRRKKKMWSNEEEDALRIGVRRFGKGNWKLILSSYNSVLIERTKVDLKDKWRNMTRY